MSYSFFQTNVLAKFGDIIRIFFYTNSPYFLCHCTEYKLTTLQVSISEENKLNATTQQLITAKISGCCLKQGSKTYSSLRQNNLQLLNDATLMSCRIRAVEHRKCAAGLSGAHPCLQTCQTTQELRMRIKYARNLSIFVIYRSPPNFHFYFFRAETLSMSECFYVRDGQLILLGVHFQKAAFSGGPYLVMEVEASLRYVRLSTNIYCDKLENISD